MYGLVVTAGIFIAAWYAGEECVMQKEDKEIVWDALLWILIFGILGARIYHVINLWPYYSQNPMLIVEIWKGGLGILGGIAGGITGLLLFARRRKIQGRKLLKYIDIAAVSLPLGQFIGRFANYFNQELYGKPTSLPWGIYIDPARRLPEVQSFSSFHPLFLYEAIGSLLIFVLLFIAKHKPWKRLKIVDGEIFLLYLSFYGILRASLETLRLSPWEIAGLNVAQALSILVSLSSLGILVYRRNKHA